MRRPIGRAALGRAALAVRHVHGNVDQAEGLVREVFAHERQAELAAIDGGKACWCTHVCFIHDSMRHSRRAQLYDVPKNYLTRESW